MSSNVLQARSSPTQEVRKRQQRGKMCRNGQCRSHNLVHPNCCAPTWRRRQEWETHHCWHQHRLGWLLFICNTPVSCPSGTAVLNLSACSRACHAPRPMALVSISVTFIFNWLRAMEKMRIDGQWRGQTAGKGNKRRKKEGQTNNTGAQKNPWAHPWTGGINVRRALVSRSHECALGCLAGDVRTLS